MKNNQYISNKAMRPCTANNFRVTEKLQNCAMDTGRGNDGDAENARHEIAGHENAAPECKGGKCET